jgi:hypothetical protein
MDEVAVQTFEPSLPNCKIESLIITNDRLRALEPFVVKLSSGANFVRICIAIVSMNSNEAAGSGLTVGWCRKAYTPSSTCVAVAKNKREFLKAGMKNL